MRSCLLFIILASCTHTKHQNPIEKANLDTGITLQKFAIGSCSHQKKPQPIWNSIIQDQPQIFVALGDNIYASSPSDKPISEAYRLQSLIPEYQTIRSKVPFLAVYDDHDSGENDAGADNTEKYSARDEFLNNFEYAKPLVAKSGEGVYHSITFGREPNKVKFVFMDTRWSRDPLIKGEQPDGRKRYIPNNDLKTQILSQEQWTWLINELQDPNAIIFLVSSIQVIAEDHQFEKWGNFPHQKKRLLELLFASKNKKTIVLSGDRHRAEFSVLKKGKQQIVEFTSSALNRPTQKIDEPNRYRVGPHYFDENYGVIQINWPEKKIDMLMKDINGQTVYKYTEAF